MVSTARVQVAGATCPFGHNEARKWGEDWRSLSHRIAGSVHAGTDSLRSGPLRHRTSLWNLLA